MLHAIIVLVNLVGDLWALCASISSSRQFVDRHVTALKEKSGPATQQKQEMHVIEAWKAAVICM